MKIEKNSARDNGYQENKQVKFKHIDGIYLKKFRSFAGGDERKIQLGRHLTILTGKNGTMKSTILGLIAYPFESPNNAKDNFNQDLKPGWDDIFKLSFSHDKEVFRYYLLATTDTDKQFAEQVRVYPRKEENRFRVTTGKDNSKGLGNFLLNTSYISLKRLYPMIHTKAQPINSHQSGPDEDYKQHSEEDQKWIGNAYNNVIQRKTFMHSEKIQDPDTKETFGPANTYYNFDTMSSGEDNLGAIFNKMIAFEKFKAFQNNDALNGVLCIDEVEASLHPVSQIRLIEFLRAWAKKHNIQVVMSTHSLYIIKHCLSIQNKYVDGKQDIVINNISTMYVGNDNNYPIMVNPDYDVIHKELTYEDLSDENSFTHKINIIVEDDEAKFFINQIFNRKTAFKKAIDFISGIDSSNKGSGYLTLVNLSKNANKILKDSIVIVDPDVPDSALSGTDSEYIIRLPDVDSQNLPIEKRVILFISELEGDAEFFRKIKKEKADIESKLMDAGIKLDGVIEQKTEVYKKWRENNRVIFNKGLEIYIKDNHKIFDSFRKQVVSLINKKRKRYAAPPIVIK